MDIIILCLILDPKTRSIESHKSNMKQIIKTFIYITKYITKYIVSLLVNGHIIVFLKYLTFLLSWCSVVDETWIHQVMCNINIFDLICKKNINSSVKVNSWTGLVTKITNSKIFQMELTAQIKVQNWPMVKHELFNIQVVLGRIMSSKMSTS